MRRRCRRFPGFAPTGWLGTGGPAACGSGTALPGHPSLARPGGSRLGLLVAGTAFEMVQVHPLEEISRAALASLRHGGLAALEVAQVLQDLIARLIHDWIEVLVDDALGVGRGRAEPQVIGVHEAEQAAERCLLHHVELSEDLV